MKAKKVMALMLCAAMVTSNDLAFAFSMLFSRIKNLLKIPHDLLFFFHRTVQLFFYFPYIGFP